MIRSFQHNGLKRYWNSGSTARIPANMAERIADFLTVLDTAARPADMDQPGYRFHALRGHRPTRYSVRVTANWRLTFEWDDTEMSATRVNLEDYH